jgi:cytochrome c oxidase subunit II
MKKKWNAGILAVVSSFLLTACGAIGSTTNIPANAQVVKVVASNWSWALSKTTFAVNQPIDFVLTSTSGDHGFTIADTKVSQVLSQGAKELNVVWTPTKPGTYHIVCTEFCGAGHDGMFATFQVRK